jgi:hypothetical protein
MWAIDLARDYLLRRFERDIAESSDEDAYSLEQASRGAASRLMEKNLAFYGNHVRLIRHA